MLTTLSASRAREAGAAAADLAPSIKTGLNNLDRLLSRLTRTVLSEDADPELKHSVFLRRKTGANVEYARTLLLRLEQDVSAAAGGVKIASQRQAIVADLAIKRETVKQLNRTLIELDQLDVDDDDEEEQEAGSQGMGDDGVEFGGGAREFGGATGSKATNSHGPASVHKDDGSTQQRALNPASDSPQPSVRARKTGASGAEPSRQSSATTSSSLFAGRPTPPQPSSLQTREQHLATSEAEQEVIKASLLTLATQLKASNLSFAQSLEEEKGVLDAAVKGLDKNALGLEGAERRMGTLRKMSEGQGLYGRLKLYALIAALWVAAFLLVFVGPKLRF